MCVCNGKMLLRLIIVGLDLKVKSLTFILPVAKLLSQAPELKKKHLRLDRGLLNTAYRLHM